MDDDESVGAQIGWYGDEMDDDDEDEAVSLQNARLLSATKFYGPGNKYYIPKADRARNIRECRELGAATNGRWVRAWRTCVDCENVQKGYGIAKEIRCPKRYW